MIEPNLPMKRFLILILLLSNTVFAQMKQKEISTVYLNYPDYTIKTDILSAKKKIATKENLTYYWFASNKVMETKGGYDGKVLNGSYTSFYLSSNLKEKGSFKNGLKNGEWITWYENGKINEIITWRKGIKAGRYKNNDNNGNLISEACYKNDKLNGYQTNYKDGKITEKRKYKNGVEIIKVQKDVTSNDSTSGKPKNEFKIVKKKVKSIFQKKEKKEIKQEGERPENNTAKIKSEKTSKEKFRALFKKKDSSEKTEKTQNKDK